MGAFRLIGRAIRRVEILAGLVTMIERTPVPICRRTPIRGAAGADIRVGETPGAVLANGPWSVAENMRP
jgi:hypothetical protein